jgi:hypothetical protein
VKQAASLCGANCMYISGDIDGSLDSMRQFWLFMLVAATF